MVKKKNPNESVHKSGTKEAIHDSAHQLQAEPPRLFFVNESDAKTGFQSKNVTSQNGE